MSGSVLGPDQVKKVNAAFPALVAHLRGLLEKDHSGVGLMRVHCQVESFDSDEMARIFRDLSFISPKEKLALVRAAIYQLIALDPLLFVAPEVAVEEMSSKRPVEPEAPKTFTPPPFKLNVNVSEAVEIAKKDTKPTPKVTSTHTPKIANNLEAGKKEQKAADLARAAEVEEIRETPAKDVK
jgi:hypothetical protein